MDTFELTVPDRSAIPVLVEVPHAGLGVPDDLRPGLLATRQALMRDADIYVDKLSARVPEVGATLLCATLSRYVVDLNRAPDDVDRETVPDHPSPKAIQPRGVVWRVGTDGRTALPRPLRLDELKQRIADYHTPYHTEVERQLERLRRRFGFVVLLAAHSMPSTGRGVGGTVRRADIVPGTRGRTTAASPVIDTVDRHFRERGMSVRHDEPYRGGWTTGHYGRPRQGIHAIQVELNRGLYVDEKTHEPLAEGVSSLQEALMTLAEKLGRLDLSRSSPGQ